MLPIRITTLWAKTTGNMKTTHLLKRTYLPDGMTVQHINNVLFKRRWESGYNFCQMRKTTTWAKAKHYCNGENGLKNDL